MNVTLGSTVCIRRAPSTHGVVMHVVSRVTSGGVAIFECGRRRHESALDVAYINQTCQRCTQAIKDREGLL